MIMMIMIHFYEIVDRQKCVKPSFQPGPFYEILTSETSDSLKAGSEPVKNFLY